MSPIASGLGGAVGIASESTYGTWAAPTRALEVRSSKLQGNTRIVQGTGLAYNRSIDLGSRRSITYRDAAGDVSMEFLNTGMAMFMQHIMGSTAGLTQIGSSSAYKQVCTYGVPDNQNYFSLQELVPDATGTYYPECFYGCKITKTTFTIDMQNPLMLDLSIDSQHQDEAQAAFTPSYVSNSAIFTGFGMQFKAGALGSEVFIDGVKKFTLMIERTLKVDRIYLGAAGTYKKEPITNGLTKITGSMDVDLLPTNKAALWDLSRSQAPVPSLVADFVGPAIGSSGHNNELVLGVNSVYIDSPGGSPELDGPDLATTTLNFSVLLDGSNDNPFTSTLTTADSTL